MAHSCKHLEPRRRPVQKRAQFTYDAILQAAAEVFGREGYGATTTQVAQRAGVSVGTLYQYFPHKDALLVTLFHRHLDEATAAVDRWMQLQVDLESLVRHFVQGTLAQHAHAPGLHRVLLIHGTETPELRERLGQLEERVRAWVVDRLRTEPAVRAPDLGLAAHLVVRLVEDLCHHRIVHPDEGVSEGAFVDEVVVMVCSYLGAERQGAGSA